MSLNVTGLNLYTDEISSGLVKEILLQANTIKGDIINVKYGIIGDKTALNYVKSTVNGTNALCGFVSTGSTILGQAIMQTCPIQFQEEICLDTLKKYWYDVEMERKYNTESIGTFEEVFISNKTEAVAKALDAIVWQGNAATGSGNLALCDGFFAYFAKAANSGSTVNVTRTAMTVSNSVAYVDAISALIPAAIIDNEGLSLYLSPADFATYLQALRVLNLFHYNTESKGISEIHHPGSIALKVVKTNGMSGMASGSFIASVKENLVLGISDETDLEFKIWYSQDNQALRWNSKMKIGVAAYFNELVVRSV